MRNTGFIYQRPSIQSWQFGGISGIHHDVLQENRQWIDFIPLFERQAFKYGDSMACVTFSALNCLEIFLRRTTGQEYNFSDRYTAIKSGTSSKGNTFENVALSLYRYSVAMEYLFPLNIINSRSEFYSTIPQSVEDNAKESKNIWDINYEFIPDDPYTIWEALKYAPVQIGIYAYGSLKNGIYQANFSKKPNHGVVCIGGEYGKYLLIFDSYDNPNPVKKIAWNTPIWGALMYKITPKTELMYPFIENEVYILTEAPGGSYFYAGKKLMKIDEPNGQMIQILSRQNKLQHKTLTKRDMEGVEIYNFKGEKI